MKIQPFIDYFRGLWNLFCDHPVQIIIVLGILLAIAAIIRNQGRQDDDRNAAIVSAPSVPSGGQNSVSSAVRMAA